MKHSICFFTGYGALERKLGSLHISVRGMCFNALTRSALGSLSTGKVNALCSLSRARKQDDLIIDDAENTAAYCGKMILTLADISDNALLERPDHWSMVGKHADVAVGKRYERIACHRIADHTVCRCDLKMDLICHGALPELIALGEHFVDSSAHEERLLGQIVALAAQDSLEAADGILHLDICALYAGKVFSNVERL